MIDDAITLSERLKKQIEFLIEIDKIKSIFRKTRIYDHTRYENDAEHAWHMSIMALILAEHSNFSEMNICKVIKMALIHDIVEIDAGDTFVYAANQSNKYASEKAAAIRIFGLLPEDQRDEYVALWEEFEAKVTPEALFAGALDRMGPVMQNHFDHGHAWKGHNVPSEKVLSVNSQIDKGSHVLWDFVQQLINLSAKRGDFGAGENSAK